MKAFTGVRDVDKIILNNLKPEDLANVCKIKNEYIRGLCNDIYHSKVRTEFPRSINNKPVDMNWLDFYDLLTEGDKQYKNLLALAKAFKGVPPNASLLYPGGTKINRGSVKSLLRQWIAKYSEIMTAEMIQDASIEISESL